mgnify:CR=1 FL=1
MQPAAVTASIAMIKEVRSISTGVHHAGVFLQERTAMTPSFGPASRAVAVLMSARPVLLLYVRTSRATALLFERMFR